MIRKVNIATFRVLCATVMVEVANGCTTPRHRRGPHPSLKNPAIKYTGSNKQHQKSKQ